MIAISAHYDGKVIIPDEPVVDCRACPRQPESASGFVCLARSLPVRHAQRDAGGRLQPSTEPRSPAPIPVLLGACSLAVLLCVGCRRPPATLSVRTEKSTIKAGAPVVVQVELTNRSSREIVVPFGMSGGGIFLYGVEVRDEAGHLAPETKLGNEANEARKTLSMRVRCRPNNGLVGPERPSELYDLAKPGQYTIQYSAAVAVVPAQVATETKAELHPTTINRTSSPYSS